HIIRNLHASEYLGKKIDLEILLLLAANNKDLVKDKKGILEKFRTSLAWNHGDVHMVLWKDHGGEEDDNAISLRDRLLQIWNPTTTFEKVMLFHVNNRSNQHPHAQWYEWFTKMTSSNHNSHDDMIAGIGLSTKQLHNQLQKAGLLATTSDNRQQPFLFPSYMDWSSGFAPFPSVWQDFVDYVDCVEQYGGDEEKKKTKFSYSDIEQTWEEFVQAKHNTYYHLYQFLENGEPLYGNDDWVIGAGTAKSRHLRSASAGFPSKTTSLTKYHYRNNNRTNLIELPPTPRLRTAVMSAAVGYPIATFKQFVGTLRQHYHGDVWLAINVTVTDEIQDICQADRYDLCLHTDFRDSVFQGDPFGEFYNDESIVQNADMDQQHLYIYEHEMIMNPWHFRKMAECHIYDAYSKNVAGKWILNSGSVIATPLVWKELGYYNRLWDTCNDQIVYNAWIYTDYQDLLTEHKYNEHIPNVTMHFHRQGEGAMNIVGYAKGEGGFVHQNSQGQFLGRNCLASPVVYQFDRV
ncbi:MAG: hypothetical protein SGILL_010801, partial [Bacillariaceae sp.]